MNKKEYKGLLKGINRNIVECKFRTVESWLYDHSWINRNIVECKYRKEVNNYHNLCELIETLWNVNSGHTLCPSLELIETLWNVNLNSWRLISPSIRINRNIVECKLLTYNFKSFCLVWINRNIVECKSTLQNG